MQDIFNALGATLLHSLWQGALLAALAGLVLPIAARASAATRYQLLIGLLILFCGAVTVTFFYQLPSAAAPVSGAAINPSGAVLLIHAAGRLENQTFWQGIVAFVHLHNAIIVYVWLAVVTFRAILLAIGLRGVYQLRNTGLTPVNMEWTNRIAEMAATLGVKRAVQLAESALAKAPMVIGHLKPLILVPVGLLTALSAAEVEAILAHELAHIRRRDYLVNLLISLLEILFFFNPAILWISALIKDEREHCCDDIAVKITSSTAVFIKALAACEEHQQVLNYAMAFTGRGGLFARSSRLLMGTKPGFNKAEKSLVALCLLSVMLLTTAFTQHKTIKQAAIRIAKAVKPAPLLPRKVIKESLVSPAAPLAPVKHVAALLQPLSAGWPEDTIKHTAITLKIDTDINLNYNNNQNYNINNNKNYNAGYNKNYNAGKNKNRYAAPALTARLDSLHAIRGPLQKAGIASPVPGNRTEPVIKLMNGEEQTANDIAEELAKVMMQGGIVSQVKSFKMSTNSLIVNNKKVSDDDFKNFKEKHIKYFHNGTTVYYNFDTKTSNLHIKD